MKKIVNISISFTLAFSILLGYAGVPVYKMICEKEGKTIVSFVDMKEACKHNAENHSPKKCCQPVKETTSCCDYSSDFFQLHESTLISSQQNTTGHWLVACDFFFNNTQPDALTSLHSLYYNNNSLGLCSANSKHSHQSITQIFRI